ncbi:outer membrane beta-barrel protein [Colwellia sp. D2M02]|uniref:outer membrane beta-barrel protein n=1 Tax=Colwellia sp. D2M02 TaxID=2841562 RepID=UPI001C07F696|nr:outer membrane beta-barrel protein [Colwellia sp. D2M02]MBU2894004.1 outer membrane beta-barrel protein [Colwellia sp. D2M02]
MKSLKTILITSLSCLSLNAFANNANQFTYFGVSLQNSSYDDINFHPQVDTSALSPLEYHESTSKTGWKLFAGHQFNRYLAVEGALASFGSANFSVTEEQANGTMKTLHQGSFDTMGLDIRAVGTYPITDNLFLKAHLGALLWDNDFTFLTNSSNELDTQKKSDTGVSLTTGLGIAYAFNNSVALSLDYETTEIAHIATKNLGLSVLFRF